MQMKFGTEERDSSSANYQIKINQVFMKFVIHIFTQLYHHI